MDVCITKSRLLWSSYVFILDHVLTYGWCDFVDKQLFFLYWDKIYSQISLQILQPTISILYITERGHCTHVECTHGLVDWPGAINWESACKWWAVSWGLVHRWWVLSGWFKHHRQWVSRTVVHEWWAINWRWSLWRGWFIYPWCKVGCDLILMSPWWHADKDWSLENYWWGIS